MVIKGLSLPIKDAKFDGNLVGVNFSPTFLVTHIFFVDDVILFGMGLVNE